LNYAIYGKIIIDDIRLASGALARGVLGGGGPQAVFGARLWSDSVGFLSRSGDDLGAEHVAVLRRLDVDLSGWRRLPGIPTPRYVLDYDENEYLAGGGLATGFDNWARLLSQPLNLPRAYRHPRLIHLITEFPDEPMVRTALELSERGTIFSLEPLGVSLSGARLDGMLALLRQVDLVTPDWPTASGIAGRDDVVGVVRHWSGLGPRAIAVRHGRRGSYVWSREHDAVWQIPAVPAMVVDPTGAGNAYGGGLAVGWAETGDVLLAGCYGAIAAAFLVRHVGLPEMSNDLRRQAQALLDQTLSTARQL
jgi:sugar/nucleoside kinase (ribokinase family)